MAKPDYAARRTAQRAQRIARARHNLAQPASSMDGVVAMSRSHGDRVIAGFAVALGVAVVCHVGVAFAAFCSTPTQADKIDKPVKVRVVMAPKPKPVEPVEEPKVAPPEPKTLAPIERPRPLPTKAKTREPSPTPKETAPEPVAIVGLTLESTSSSASGPGFAVGDTLAGTTDRIAASAREPQRDLPLPSPTPALPVSRNRRAAPRAAAGVRVAPAQRLAKVEPVYPPLLERQRIEADVTVRVQIAASGQLMQVELVRGADEIAFNEAALAAAKKERFAPETHDGQAVETSLTYTYRFRITP